MTATCTRCDAEIALISEMPGLLCVRCWIDRNAEAELYSQGYTIAQAKAIVARLVSNGAAR